MNARQVKQALAACADAEKAAFYPRFFKVAKGEYGNLWKRRISLLATLPFIQQGDFEHTLALAERLLDDEHDLIHKAVGWMLREVGNRDLAVERDFLDRHATEMPRTALSYAIEKLPGPLRARYMARK